MDISTLAASVDSVAEALNSGPFQEDYAATIAAAFDDDGPAGPGVVARIAMALEDANQLRRRELDYLRHAISHLEYLKPLSEAASLYVVSQRRENDAREDALTAEHWRLVEDEQAAQIAFTAADEVYARAYAAGREPEQDVRNRLSKRLADAERRLSDAIANLSRFEMEHPDRLRPGQAPSYAAAPPEDGGDVVEPVELRTQRTLWGMPVMTSEAMEPGAWMVVRGETLQEVADELLAKVRDGEWHIEQAEHGAGALRMTFRYSGARPAPLPDEWGDVQDLDMTPYRLHGRGYRAPRDI
jgi:hypothetical protein